MLRLAYVDETYGGGDDACRMGFAFADEVAELHQRRRSVAEGEESVRVFLDGETDAGLGAGETPPLPLPKGGEV